MNSSRRIPSSERSCKQRWHVHATSVCTYQSGHLLQRFFHSWKIVPQTFSIIDTLWNKVIHIWERTEAMGESEFLEFGFLVLFVLKMNSKAPQLCSKNNNTYFALFRFPCYLCIPSFQLFTLNLGKNICFSKRLFICYPTVSLNSNGKLYRQNINA